MIEPSTVVPIGDSASSGQVFLDVAPALALVTLAVVLVLAFAVRNHIRGEFLDEQVAGRGSTAIVGMWLRQCFAWSMRPLAAILLWSKLPPAAVTALALLLAVGAGAALATGHFTLGTLLFLSSGLCDFLDGRLARAQGTASSRGALLDSVIDRYVEVVIFAGLAWYYRNSWVLAVVLAASAGSFAVPYVRARGESLGVSFANIGIVQRPERIVILGASLLLSPVLEALLPPPVGAPSQRMLVFGLILLAVTTAISSAQRLIFGLRALAGRADSPLNLFGRGSLLRSATVGGIATGTDFLLVLALVNLATVHPALATLVGCLLGAIVNFLLNRFWTFDSRSSVTVMAARYAFVSATSAGLNAGLVAVLCLLPALPVLLIWWAARGLVYLLWNYPLHRDYVFAREVAPEGESHSSRDSAPMGDTDRAPPSGLVHVEANH